MCLTGYCDVLGGLTCKARLADGATCNPMMMGMECLSGSCNAVTMKCDPTQSNRCVMP